MASSPVVASDVRVGVCGPPLGGAPPPLVGGLDPPLGRPQPLLRALELAVVEALAVAQQLLEVLRQTGYTSQNVNFSGRQVALCPNLVLQPQRTN